MLDLLKEALPQILVAVLIPIAGIVGVLGASILKNLLSRIKNENLQNLAWGAVRFANQKFKDLHGADKFDKAYERVANKIKGVSKEDIETAIEAAVNGVNESLGKPGKASTE